ncbi:MAG: hypothetical protein M1838_005865 [Thelocarpon superellum]|nr:MAG: hypothetical protein M1838_005865 [Thelocarpon superellum]
MASSESGDGSLWVFNSLGKKRMKFVPLDHSGRKVTWYCCGPTVYDAGHLGHARNYVTTDILRRILRDYFGYNVEFVMNVTDIDDKIIVRARQQHLVADFIAKHPAVNDEALQTTKTAYAAYAKRHLPKLPESLNPATYEQATGAAYGPILDGTGTLSGGRVPGDDEAKIKMHHKSMQAASKALVTAQTSPTSVSPTEFYLATTDVLLPYLDALYSTSISPSDYGIFTKLTQHWERRFREDLRMLNCLPPTTTTRVSEFVEEIAAFVKRIQDKGFAYATSDGSVYFDIQAFEAAGNTYARLEPWNRNDRELQADGEGSLTKKTSEKRSDADFALWKASKPGEPSWEGPWGRGRPGWHIECSAMASEVLGGRIDIHSGGIDLAFPHHDNELAQSEAYWVDSCQDNGKHHCQHDWVNYFLHMGHLSIQGSKMSKSLKNFTTIDAALRKGGGWTARGLRIVFLLGGWKERIEVTDDVVGRAGTWETTVQVRPLPAVVKRGLIWAQNFFTNIKALMAEEAQLENSGQQVPQLFRQPERELRDELSRAQVKVDEALRDSFNTPAVMAVIEELITRSNVYLSKQRTARTSLAVVEEVARWITRMIDIFGLDAAASGSRGGDKIGWSASASSEDGAKPSDVHTEAFEPFLRGVSRYRDQIRQIAMANPSVKKELLALSDTLRDNEFVNIGISLDDREGGQPALVKAVPKTDLLAVREQKKREAASAEQRKEDARLERERVEREKLEKGRTSHLDMFRTAEYRAWDDDGIPTQDAQGVEITKSRSKKLRKDWDRQKRLHEAWLAAQGPKDAA